MNNCPQCDDVPTVVSNNDEQFSIRCDFCGFQTRFYITEYEAISSWNEVYDIVDMRSDAVAAVLRNESRDTIKSYLMKCSLDLIIQYFQLAHDNDWEWEDIKGRMYKQFKVTELSYDRIKKKITKLQENDF